MNSISNKHHYIPIFFTKGFTSEGGYLYVYDKTKDIIHYKKKSPSSIFFELGRNIGKIHDKEFDEIETVQYGSLDNVTSKVIETVRYCEDPTSLLDVNLMVQLSWFANNLYWRLPVNDERYDTIYSSNNINPEEIIDNTRIPNDEIIKIDLFKKFARATIPFSKFNLEQNHVEITADIIKLPIKYLLLNDNPVVYRNEPKINFDVYQELIVPISSDIIFLIIEKNKYNIINEHIIIYLNLLAIHKAKNYVVGHDLEKLNVMINLYKQLVKDKEIFSAEKIYNFISGDEAFLKFN